ncbi:hypothetical protein SAMN04487895_12413 [Paenibacillus sophorae]|uniref:TMEM198/TM7SF3 family protein n=1 Tax=Paenibacillus sophorae TaxID=1333845 RepID=A0A1H8VGC5_9BACL|nr:hypothetical protein [Paenibacillus sophorae]QWU15408.1 TMEM198/TM7SF3 family protein [Paenibacillus sophorae]SEP14451.1 hypothetical protein SAMN04487895_12413 [Paenibacillus sophorae]
MSNWIIAAIFYTFIICWSFGFIHRFRSTVTGTIAMISPMANGMIAGLGSGTIIGAGFSSNIFLSLLISVLTGILAGGITGSLIHIGAFLNGALSGMMAGLMGAMLIVMLPSSEWNRVIFIFMVACGFLQFVHTLMLQGQIEESILKRSPWIFSTPSLMFLAITALIILYSTSCSPGTLNQNNKHPNHSMMNMK